MGSPMPHVSSESCMPLRTSMIVGVRAILTSPFNSPRHYTEPANPTVRHLPSLFCAGANWLPICNMLASELRSHASSENACLT